MAPTPFPYSPHSLKSNLFKIPERKPAENPSPAPTVSSGFYTL